MAEPRLFRAGHVRSRDLKIVAVSALFIGGVSGRLLLDRTGSSMAFLVGGGLRVLIALLWLRVPCEGRIELL